MSPYPVRALALITAVLMVVGQLLAWLGEVVGSILAVVSTFFYAFCRWQANKDLKQGPDGPHELAVGLCSLTETPDVSVIGRPV